MLSARAQAAAARWDRASDTARANDANGPATRRAIDVDGVDGAEGIGAAIVFPPPPPPRGKAVAAAAVVFVVVVVVGNGEDGDGRFAHVLDDEGGHIEEAAAAASWNDNTKMIMIARGG